MLTPVVLALGLLLSTLAAAPITQSDRDKLIQDLERSRKIFLDAIADVKTEAQWNYKPAPDRWSVAECAAHIVAAEEYFRQNVREALKNPPLPAAQQSDAGDAMLSKIMRDRSQRFQVPAALEPTGKVKPKAQTIANGVDVRVHGFLCFSMKPSTATFIGSILFCITSHRISSLMPK